MDASLSTVLQADPGAAAIIAAAIVAQAVVASHVVDAVKAVIRKVAPEWSLTPWAASTICAVIAVLLAIRTLLETDYSWDVWVLGIVIAMATGPFYHDLRESKKKAVKLNGQATTTVDS